MKKKDKRKALGKGINALIPDFEKGEGETQKKDGLIFIPLEEIVPGQNQPRKHFDDEKLAELVESIKENGVVQPVVVQKSKDNYELICGERRWRACQKAGLKRIPALVRDVNNTESLQIALIENIHRQDVGLWVVIHEGEVVGCLLAMGPSLLLPSVHIYCAWIKQGLPVKSKDFFDKPFTDWVRSLGCNEITICSCSHKVTLVFPIALSFFQAGQPSLLGSCFRVVNTKILTSKVKILSKHPKGLSGVVKFLSLYP